MRRASGPCVRAHKAPPPWRLARRRSPPDLVYSRFVKRHNPNAPLHLYSPPDHGVAHVTAALSPHATRRWTPPPTTARLTTYRSRRTARTPRSASTRSRPRSTPIRARRSRRARAVASSLVVVARRLVARRRKERTARERTRDRPTAPSRPPADHTLWTRRRVRVVLRVSRVACRVSRVAVCASYRVVRRVVSCVVRRVACRVASRRARCAQSIFIKLVKQPMYYAFGWSSISFVGILTLPAVSRQVP